MILKSEAQLVPGFILSPPTPWPDPGFLTSSTPTKFLFPEESGGKNPPEPRFPKGPKAEAAPTLLPQSRWGHARSRRGAGPPPLPPAARVGVRTGPWTTPWGHGRPLGHSRPGSRPRVSLVSDLPAAKCVTSARRSGDTCCRPRHAESRSPSLGPSQAMARGRAERAAVGQQRSRTRGSGVRAARGNELGPAALRSRGRAGPQCARSRRRWGPRSPGSADCPSAPRLLLANILV